MPQSPEEFLRGYRSEDEEAADERRASQWDDVDYSGPGRVPTTGQSYGQSPVNLQPGTVFDDDFDELMQDAQRSVNRAVRGPTSGPGSVTRAFDELFQDAQGSVNPAVSGPTSGRSFAGESLGDFLNNLRQENEASVAASSTRKGALNSTLRELSNNPLDLKRNLVTEFVARGDQQTNPNLVSIADEVFNEAKSQGFNPRGSWRSATSRDLAEDNNVTQSVNRYFDAKQEQLRSNLFGLGSNALSKKLEGIKDTANRAFSRVSYPKIVADAFALRNPVVEPGGPVAEGSFINPQAAKFLREFKPQTSADGVYTGYKSPFGTSVDIAGSKESGYNLAFKGPFEYKRSGVIRKEIKRELEQADTLEKRGFTEKAASLRDAAINKQELLNEPLRSPALRYTLGAALENVPVGSTVTADPIGASAGSRARIYSALTNNALVTDPGVVPNRNAYPTEEEFRAAREGLQSPANYSYGEMISRNTTRDRIKSEKISPTTWLNVKGEKREFNPSALKDEMIRATYNLPGEADVSGLRDNPLGLLQRTNRIDFTKPVITTDSPIYKFRKGLKGGLGVSAADFIPTPEAVQSFYAGKPKEGIRNMAETFIGGLPTAVAVGGTVAAAPVLAPVASGIGAGLTGVALARAGNEAVRQQTGEGVVSKVRQFLGTADRTGVSSSSPRRTTPSTVTPTIRPMTEAQKIEQNRRAARSELERRVDLAKERFNPMKGEFGLSEVLFGR